MHLISQIINMIFPNVCGICRKVCKQDICPKCLYELNNIKQCKKHIYLQKEFTTHMYIFKYEDFIRKNLIKYKFKDEAYRYKAFAKFIIKDKKICVFLKKYDIIIPVPISIKRQKQRGYNQSELIAKEIEKCLCNIEVRNDILYKIKDTIPQSMLKRRAKKV